MATDFPRLRNVMWLKNNNGNYEPLCDFTDFTDVTTTIDDAEEKQPEPQRKTFAMPDVTFRIVCRMRITKAERRKLLGWRTCIPIINTRRRQIERVARMKKRCAKC